MQHKLKLDKVGRSVVKLQRGGSSPKSTVYAIQMIFVPPSWLCVTPLVILRRRHCYSYPALVSPQLSILQPFDPVHTYSYNTALHTPIPQHPLNILIVARCDCAIV